MYKFKPIKGLLFSLALTVFFIFVGVIMYIGDDLSTLNRVIIIAGISIALISIVILMFIKVEIKEKALKAYAYYYLDYSLSRRKRNSIREIQFSEIASFNIHYNKGKKFSSATYLELKLNSIQQPVFISVMGYTKNQINEFTKLLHENIHK